MEEQIDKHIKFLNLSNVTAGIIIITFFSIVFSIFLHIYVVWNTIISRLVIVLSVVILSSTFFAKQR